MINGISILDEIKRGGYEASVITTFNAYLPFYEDVVLRHLKSHGVRHNILMMDAAQATQSIQSHPPRLAGRHYTLIPMRAHQAFHPKVIFLAGKKKGGLLIGSHNMTLSGFGYNRELTNLIRVNSLDDKAAILILQSAWQQIINWTEFQAIELPKHFVDMVTKTADFAPWLKESVPQILGNGVVISSQYGAPSLWTQLKNHIDGQVRRVIIAGAFFDSEYRFIRRVLEELKPKEMVVGIDPSTVQMPFISEIAGVKFTNCSKIGKSETEEKKAGYLHAKAMVLETVRGDTILAVGSANPSSYAWLSDGLSGNVEAMFIKRGDAAAVTARDLGLLDIPSMPILSREDWNDVTENWQEYLEKEKNISARTGIALAHEGGISFDLLGEDHPAIIQCELLGQERDLLTTCVATLSEGKYQAVIADGIKQLACFLRFEIANCFVTCIVQQQKLIEENSRTGPQRRFREALASLSTDTPDLETLIQCVDKIIFSKDGESNRIAENIRPPHIVEGRPEDGTANIGGGLSVDVSDTKKTKKKYRLRQSDDLAYLLDLLIYHLNQEVQADLNSTLEKKDGKGRSEEEQVGAEDDDGQQGNGQNEIDMAARTLDLCHSKIRILIFRMVKQLDSLKAGKNTTSEVIVRLTAVLAVLRQLRNCDGKVSWIKPGQTSVPKEFRARLFDGVVRNLFESPNSIIYPNEDLADADELARLKGLILWLAWDSGIRIERRKVYDEQSNERDLRIRNNALMIALAQLVKEDEVVVEETRLSIAPFCSSNLDWLNWILQMDRRLTDIFNNPEHLTRTSHDVKHQLAINPAKPELGVRLVLRQYDKKTELAYFATDKDHVAYLSNSLRFFAI